MLEETGKAQLGTTSLFRPDNFAFTTIRYSLNQRGLYKGAVRDEKNKKTAEVSLYAN